MVRRVFFSFHYEKDIIKVAQVRNSDITKSNLDISGFIDAAKWEKLKKKSDDTIKEWINQNLKNTSVTVVLIGTETSTRKWVKYEIKESYNRKNGILGIYIHNCKDFDGQTSEKGNNPFNELYISENGQKTYLSEIYPTYDWIEDHGYDNIVDWIENAAKEAGK